jgi:hypothetical protein
VCLAVVSSSFSQDVEAINLIYVDNDAPADPGPQDPAVSDPGEDGTLEHPFDMIQEGIDEAQIGETVVVLDGTYWENINFNGKIISVTGFDPSSKQDKPLPYPIIDGKNQGSVVTFNHGEDPNAVLSGFEIRGGLSNMGSAIQCVGSNPTISHCIIA